MAHKPSTVSVRDYLRIIFRRRYLLFVPICLSIIAIVPLWMAIPPKFQAISVVMRKDLSASTGAGAALTRPSVNALRTEILTTANLYSIINKAKLPMPDDQARLQAMFQDLRRAISIQIIPKDRGEDFVQFSVIYPSSRDAFMIANAVAEDYIEHSISASQEDLKRTVDYYKTEADDAYTKLKEAEHRLEQYYSEHWGTLAEVKRGILDDINRRKIDMDSHQLLLTDAEQRLIEISRLLEQSADAQAAEPPNDEQPMTSAQDLERDISQLRTTLDNLLLRYKPGHPDVMRVQEILAEREKRLEDIMTARAGGEGITTDTFAELLTERRNLEMFVAGKKKVIAEIKSNILAREAAIKEVVSKEKDWVDWEREKARQEERYAQSSRRLADARNSLAAMIGDYGIRAEMKDSAIEPELPYKGESLQIAMGALGAGIAIGLLLLFLAEFSDHSLRGIEDAAAFLDIPVLGSLSVIVTPQARLRKRLRAFWSAAALIILPLILAVIVVAWDAARPGMYDRLADRARAFFQMSR